MLKEFKEFIMRGNVVDLAVGVIIGGAFGKIIDSLVADIIMPILGKIMGDPNYFLNWTASGIPIGKFVQAIFNFLIIAFVLFLIVRTMNRMKKAEIPTVSGPSETDLLIQIRDLLKK